MSPNSKTHKAEFSVLFWRGSFNGGELVCLHHSVFQEITGTLCVLAFGLSEREGAHENLFNPSVGRQRTSRVALWWPTGPSVTVCHWGGHQLGNPPHQRLCPGRDKSTHKLVLACGTCEKCSNAPTVFLFQAVLNQNVNTSSWPWTLSRRIRGRSSQSHYLCGVAKMQ